ncbi:MAG: hypothetical protein R2879_19430 [Saprospiraceae bacterium]
MKTRFNSILAIVFLLFAGSFYANSQIAISNLDEVGKIKNGTTYIAMKDPGSEKSKPYIKVFKDNWTLSKIEFIKYTDIEKYISKGSSFLTMGGYETNVQFTTLYHNGSSRNGINYSNTHLYLELWTCDDKYFEKERKKFKDRYKNEVARIELFTDFETLRDPDKLYQSEYDGEGHIRNWGPGILKNYLQALMSFLNKKEDRSLYSGIMNKEEIKKLKNEVLYVPDYVLMKFNKFTGDESKKHDEKEIFEEYDLKYQLISTDDLNQKILENKEKFYYLIYIKSSTDKYITVINSQNGELIYSKYSPMSYNIKPDDLEELQDEIK